MQRQLRALGWQMTLLVLFLWPALAAAPLAGAQAPLIPAAPPTDTIYGLSSTGTLVRFSSATPSVLSLTVPISGLESGAALAAIDFRPATGQLFGLAIKTATKSGRLYIVNPDTGAASPLGTLPFYTPLTPTLAYNIDFNPGADRVRMIDEVKDNLRVNPNNGTLTAHDLDVHLASLALIQPVALAYTPAKPGLTASTAYVYEFLSDHLYMLGGPDGVPSANGGLLTDIGASGVTSQLDDIGLDISKNGVAYLSMKASGHYNLYTLNLATGGATLVGSISNGLTPILDIAVVQRFNTYLPIVRK